MDESPTLDEASALLEEQIRKLRLGHVRLLRLTHLIEQLDACIDDLGQSTITRQHESERRQPS
ncbi:MAG: hypothetical protein IT305_25380 [Chloroflexi bacterium]|nr:hypothetical protein [Chloroflexota bacterium]